MTNRRSDVLRTLRRPSRWLPGPFAVGAVAAALGLGVAPCLGSAEGFTGCYAVRDGGGEGTEVLDSENADRLMTPASVVKLVTSMAALELLGPEHRVRTEVRSAAALLGRRLGGDLVLVGAGDPTWSNRFFADDPRTPLKTLARRVAEHVDRVDGDLTVDVSGFPGRPFPPSRAVSEVAYAYAAPTGAVAVDENVAWLRIWPGAKVGDPAKVAVEGGAGEPIDNRTVTAPEERHEKGTFDWLPSWSGDAHVARGEYPISEPAYRLPVAVQDGELRAGRALLEELRAAGVEVTGEVRVVVRAVPAQRTLAAIDSPPLGEWLEPILMDSENWLAEMLLRVVAAEALGAGRSEDGAEHVAERLTELAGLPEGALVLEDGSGLSPYDLVTPRAIVELLRWARTRPWWPEFFGALATGREGTLGSWRGLLPARLRAKTGTLRHTVALAGVVDAPPALGKPRLTFACFVNHATDERQVLRRRLAERIRGYSLVTSTRSSAGRDL